MRDLPVIDVGPLVRGGDGSRAAREIDAACREFGLFYVTGHGVDPDLQDRLEAISGEFFARPEAEKAAIAMARGGRAWRGWFPVGGELTAGVPDHKEGIYFGVELDESDARVRAGIPLHGANLFPVVPRGLRDVVLAYLAAMTGLGHALMAGIGLALGLDESWFDRHLTADPLVLFRIFHYPPAPADGVNQTTGVGEHTDYGLLTILGQDASGGLEVHTPGGWIDAPPVPGTFVCNLGDMLERMTDGRYRSTPHRVRSGGRSRLSFPFFFDPAWDADVRPVPLGADGPPSAAHPRWDGADVFAFEGTYGDYLTTKVAKVFPALAEHLT